MFKIVNEIELFIRQQPWLDFEIANYDGRSLTVIGTLDLISKPVIEIKFTDVFVVSAPLC